MTVSKKATTPSKSQLFQIDHSKLTMLKNEAEVLYDTHITGRDEFLRMYRVGVNERFSSDSLQHALTMYAEKIIQGYSVVHHLTPEYFAGGGQFQPYMAFTLRKPDTVRDAELAVIMAKVEADYMIALEAERLAELERQVELRFATEQRAAETARAEQELKDKQRLREEVLSAWGQSV